jgi:hypothetical protein
VRVPLTATGSTLRNISITLARGNRTIATTRLARLANTKVVTITVRHHLKPGSYRITATAANARTAIDHFSIA